MIKMDDYEYFRIAHYKYGHTIRKISRDTRKARPTIRKALAGQEPSYHLKEAREKPVMKAYVEAITNWLLGDKEAPAKQRHTAKRIYERLIEEYEFQGSESIVRKTVRELKEELHLVYHEAFIPSDPAKRNGAEVDWGEVWIKLKGIDQKVYMFCMRSKYSGKLFAKLYPVMLQECFFNGHIEAFAYFGGVFEELVYDNLTSAVKKVLRGKGRVEQTAFISFRSYYCFAPIFCNTCKGNEKGGVEGSVCFTRHNFLTPLPQFDFLEQANEYLLEKCLSHDTHRTQGQELTIGELFAQEKPRLLMEPQKPYNNYRLIETTVDKYLTVQVMTNRYSVPSKYVGKQVTVELGLYDVRITQQNRVISKHERNFQKHKWILDPWHYMEVLRRKNRAFKSSMILTAIETNWSPVVKKLWEIQVSKHGETDGTKEFLDTMLFFQNKDYTDMIATIEVAVENGTTNNESLKMLYEALMEKEEKREDAPIEHLPNIAQFTLPSPDVRKFDMLMEVAKNG